MRSRKFQKNSKKIQKIKKYHYSVISSQNSLEKAQREKIKIIVSFRSNSMRNRKFQKNSQKNQKIPLWQHFKPKQVGKGSEREKIKIIVSFHSDPTRKRKFKKNSKKIQ